MYHKLTINRNSLIVFLLSIVTYSTALAQTTGNNEPRQLTASGCQVAASKEAAFLKHKLTLTDGQEGKLQEVFASFYESVLKVKSADSQARGKELLKLESTRDAAIKRLLNSEQYKLYTAGKTNAKQQSALKQKQAADKLKAEKKN